MYRFLSFVLLAGLTSCSSSSNLNAAVTEANLERMGTPRAEVAQFTQDIEYDLSVHLFVHISLQAYRLEDRLKTLPPESAEAVAIENILETMTQQCQEIAEYLVRNKKLKSN